ncbi:MAG: hypothetical protein ACTSVF_02725 [Candidatus Asgardarchaeia archaeon]
MKVYDVLKDLSLIVMSLFMMDIVHEFGHAFFGILMGGNLEYIKVAFFRIYPDFAIEQEFVVGYVLVSGLYGFSRGVFLFGGSFTTLLFSTFVFFIALTVKKSKGGEAIKFLKFSGIVGSLDMPFYIIFPYLGLKHWIIIGGNFPEPIVGLEMMGIPNFISIPILLSYSFYILSLYVSKI